MNEKSRGYRDRSQIVNWNYTMESNPKKFEDLHNFTDRIPRNNFQPIASTPNVR